MKRPFLIFAAVAVLAALVAGTAYAVMRASGGGSQSESVVGRQSPQPSPVHTLAPVPAQALLLAATAAPEVSPPGQEGGSGEGGMGEQPQPGTGAPVGSFAPYDPDWTPAPLGPDEERRGNCIVPKDAVEVFPKAAVAAKGRVFDVHDEANTRYYSLPDGRCISLAGAESPPDWVAPNLLTPGPGYEKRGNCVVPNGALEVSTDAATAAGARVFDYADTRYFSLPDGRCVPVRAGKPLPDWLPPDLLTSQPAPPSAEGQGGM